jgi:hypothetical protein
VAKKMQSSEKKRMVPLDMQQKVNSIRLNTTVRQQHQEVLAKMELPEGRRVKVFSILLSGWHG